MGSWSRSFVRAESARYSTPRSRVYRSRFTRLVRVAVIVVVPVQALSAIVLLSAQPDHYSLSVTGTVSPQYDSNSVALQLAAFVVVAIVGVLSTALVIAVCTRILADAYIDNDSGAVDAFRAVRPRCSPSSGRA